MTSIYLTSAQISALYELANDTDEAVIELRSLGSEPRKEYEPAPAMAFALRGWADDDPWRILNGFGEVTPHEQ